MLGKVGIRREDKNQWERRVPLTPGEVEALIKEEGLEFAIQPSANRVYREEEYIRAGAKISEDLSDCNIILGVKEMPADLFQTNMAYLFFSHTTKGQPYNMPMLQKLMHQGCHLLDYELIADQDGRRLVFFGRQAGQAGMIETLWTWGQRLQEKGVKTPLSSIKRCLQYNHLQEAMEHIGKIGEQIKNTGFPNQAKPWTCAITGYGNVARGAQEIIERLPVKYVSPTEFKSENRQPGLSKEHLNVAVFKEEHLVQPQKDGDIFDLQDYYVHPKKYKSIFHQYLPNLDLLVNCIYWSEEYPRLVTREWLRKRWQEKYLRLQVIGDITCDIQGSVECNLGSTTPGDPVYIYNPEDGKIKYGLEGEGVAIMAVDNLPCELPREASDHFSNSLQPFIAALGRADFTGEFIDLQIPSEIKKAIILHKGELTANYNYLTKHLNL